MGTMAQGCQVAHYLANNMVYNTRKWHHQNHSNSLKHLGSNVKRPKTLLCFDITMASQMRKRI